jgi:hypothetical protein
MDVDDLYSAPYDRFIAERNALARSTEDKQESARIKALRKPTLPAWAINQVARSHQKEVRRLVELGDALRTARGEKVRSLSKERNGAVASLVEHARAALTGAGHSDSASNLERVTNTLQAASIEPDATEELLGGRLSTDMEPSGFASLPLALVEDVDDEVDPAARRKARAEIKKLEAAAAKAEREADALERAAESAEDAAKAARRAARTARRRAEAARAKADAAAG